jgi:hypothetical protein
MARYFCEMAIILLVLFFIILFSMFFWAGKFLAWFLAPGASFMLKLAVLPLALAPFLAYKTIVVPVQVFSLLPGYYKRSFLLGFFAHILFIAGAILIYGTLLAVALTLLLPHPA